MALAIFLKLWTAQTMANSPATFSLPRTLKPRNPLFLIDQRPVPRWLCVACKHFELKPLPFCGSFLVAVILYHPYWWCVHDLFPIGNNGCGTGSQHRSQHGPDIRRSPAFDSLIITKPVQQDRWRYYRLHGTGSLPWPVYALMLLQVFCVAFRLCRCHVGIHTLLL